MASLPVPPPVADLALPAATPAPTTPVVATTTPTTPAPTTPVVATTTPADEKKMAVPPVVDAAADLAVVRSSLDKLVDAMQKVFERVDEKASAAACVDYKKLVAQTNDQDVLADLKLFVTSSKAGLSDGKYGGLVLRYNPTDPAPGNPIINVSSCHTTAVKIRTDRAAELKAMPDVIKKSRATESGFELLSADRILLNIYRIATTIDKTNEDFKKEFVAVKARLGIVDATPRNTQPFVFDISMIGKITNVLNASFQNAELAPDLERLNKQASSLESPGEAAALFSSTITNPKFMSAIGKVFSQEFKMN